MTHPIEKRRFLWFLMTLVPLLMVFTLRFVVPHAWAAEEKAPIGVQLNGTGRIDSIEKDHVVIDDRLIRLSPRVKFYTARRTMTTRASLSEGSYIGYVTNTKGEIIAVWLIR